MDSENNVSSTPVAAMLVRLRPAGPWRMGPDSGSRDRVSRILHSDTLYSAVTLSMQQLGWLDEWLAATVANPDGPGVRFTSLFPFQSDRLYVIPPQHLWPPPASLMHSSRVRWKGAKFVPLSVVRTLVSGKTLSDDAWTVDAVSECLLPQGQAAGPFRTGMRTAAAMDRAGEGAAAHTTACLEFAPGAGLWFAATFSSVEAREAWAPRLGAATRLLADSGIGGERSRGWGRAEAPEFEERPLQQLLSVGNVEEGRTKGHWLLSLFHPSPNDSVDWTRGHYSLVTRSGRAQDGGAVKKATQMVAEGSVLLAAAELAGSAPDVTPEGVGHPVYRSGFALSIPIPVGEAS